MGANNCNWLHRKAKDEDANVKDFYQTIPQMSFALLENLKLAYSPETPLLDCCAGLGAISNVMKTHFNNVTEIDLFDPSNPTNFLTYFPKDMKESVLSDSEYFLRYFKKEEREKLLSDVENNFTFYDGPKYKVIVANSPFSAKYQFIDHALDIGDTFYTLFPGLSANYNKTGAYKRKKEFVGSISLYPKVLLSEELSKDGSFIQSGTQNYIWYIFDSTVERTVPFELVKDLHDYDKIVSDYLTNNF